MRRNKRVRKACIFKQKMAHLIYKTTFFETQSKPDLDMAQVCVWWTYLVSELIGPMEGSNRKRRRDWCIMAYLRIRYRLLPTGSRRSWGFGPGAGSTEPVGHRRFDAAIVANSTMVTCASSPPSELMHFVMDSNASGFIVCSESRMYHQTQIQR